MERVPRTITRQTNRLCRTQCHTITGNTLAFHLGKREQHEEKDNAITLHGGPGSIQILGRIAILKFGVVASNVHDIIKFPTEIGVATVKAIVSKTIESNQVVEPEEITRREKIPREEETKAT